MRYGNIEDSLFCVASAAIKDLRPIVYKKKIKPKDFDPLKSKYSDLPEENAERRPIEDEIEVYSFPQTWGSTALGFGGIGGSAMTTAQTTVCLGPRGDAAVYFGRRLAYTIDQVNIGFMSDVSHHNMKPCGKQGEYRAL